MRITFDKHSYFTCLTLYIDGFRFTGCKIHANKCARILKNAKKNHLFNSYSYLVKPFPLNLQRILLLSK